MRTIKFILLLVVLCTIGIIYGQKKPTHNDDGSVYVPDQETAIKVAEAIWLPIYGDKIQDEKPFVAELDKKTNIWTVHGTLSKHKLGGVAYIKLQRIDCKVLEVYHGK